MTLTVYRIPVQCTSTIYGLKFRSVKSDLVEDAYFYYYDTYCFHVSIYIYFYQPNLMITATISRD